MVDTRTANIKIGLWSVCMFYRYCEASHICTIPCFHIWTGFNLCGDVVPVKAKDICIVFERGS